MVRKKRKTGRSRGCGGKKGSGGGGEGMLVIKGFLVSFKRLNIGGIPEFVRKRVPEVWGCGTEGSASHCH